MLDRNEIARSLTGAWWLFLDRPDATRFFDLSVNGFWRSFRVIVLIAPIYALTVLAEYRADGLAAEQISASAFIFGNAIGLVIDWIAFPTLLAFAARPLGITRNYSAFIIVRNWASVIALTPFGVLALLTLFGIIGTDALGILSLAVLFVVLRYSYMIASRVLGVPMGFAIGIVAADLAVSLGVMAMVNAGFGI